MVVQYPHTITLAPAGEATQDENGNWITGSAGISIVLPCRAEPNGGGKIATTDGSLIDFAWIVYMPLSNTVLQTGEEITVMDGDAVRAKGTVKRFSRDQFNMRAWL